MIPECIKQILKKIEQNGFEAYIVGGFVRDYVLNRKTNDIDIATNALPKDLILIFGPPKRKIEYGSYHLKVESYNIDITTYRMEKSYQNGKLSDISYSMNMLEDAKRRDFTINAMYLNERESIIDIYHGKEDLQRKVLQMIGNPNVRLKEDGIRILRAIRFSLAYDLKIEKSLKIAIQKEKKNLRNVSFNKIKKELDAILLLNGFPILKKYGLLKELFILNDKIVYVEDLAGIWAQIDTSIEYPKEKVEKNNEKNIKKIINCGTINLHDLYEYGYYLCRVSATIIHFPLKKLEKMEKELPIKSKRDIALSSYEILQISKKKGKELGNLIKEIENLILEGKLKNEKEDISKYIERG